MTDDKKIINRGTFIVENEKDKEILAKYIYALAQGNQYYRPVGLKQKKG